jgi:alpha-tubulin suppressor-like RCC1 family protein
MATDNPKSVDYGKLICAGDLNSPFGAPDEHGYGNVIESIPSEIRHFAVADNRACAVCSDSKLYCWGSNWDHNISIFQFSAAQFNFPERFNAIHNNLTQTALSGVKEVYLGKSHTCALMEDSTVKCWGGLNLKGELGNGTNQSSVLAGSVQTAVNLYDVKKLALGTDHSCALIKDGTVKCWGSNDRGQLGDGTLENRNSPITVSFSE